MSRERLPLIGSSGSRTTGDPLISLFTEAIMLQEHRICSSIFWRSSVNGCHFIMIKSEKANVFIYVSFITRVILKSTKSFLILPLGVTQVQHFQIIQIGTLM